MGGCALSLSALTLRASAGESSGNPMLGVSHSQVIKLIDALRALGEPFSPDETTRLLALSQRADAESFVESETVLGSRTLARVSLDRHGIGRAAPGTAAAELLELGWRTFLIRVDNPARLTGPLKLIGRFAMPEGDLMSGIHDPQAIGNDRPELLHLATDTDWNWDWEVGQWLGFRFGSPMLPALIGEPVEYQLLQLYSQQGGTNSTTLVIGADALRGAFQFDCKGYNATFTSKPASVVSLQISDTDGRGNICSLLILDEASRLYPAPAHRIEPDVSYQPQIYRADGESIRLPPGRYSITASRGPEYLSQRHELLVSQGGALATKLERWIDPAQHHWYSSDPHVHPEGQAYNIVSKYGMTPETMARQIRGEGLSVGSVLIWSSGYYYQKQFLTGHVYESNYAQPFPELQHANNSVLKLRPTPHDAQSLVRYDVEQAAFPSNLMGHPVLLRLKNHNWPGGGSLYDWPSWNLPLFQWARAQGALGGYAHAGLDPIALTASELPNYEIPRLFGIGANEAVVDVANGYVDFLAGGENRPEADLNLWYHLLNCGFRLPMIGETDFIAGASRAGQIRTYVRLDRPPTGDAGYDAWAEGIKAGRVYFGDGRSHYIDLRVSRQRAGDGPIELRKSGRLVLEATIAARLEPKPFDVDEENNRLNTLRYWHIERARIGESRRVPLELVINGRAVQRHEIVADGELREMTFAIEVSRSSWLALRILPSSHSAPFFVQVAGKPVRASKRSAQWCLDCVDVLWERHAKRIRDAERVAAAAAWQRAREVYRKILVESETA